MRGVNLLELLIEPKAFFTKIGIKNIKDFISIEIEPINGIYDFINKEEHKNNFDFIKLLAEDGDIEKILQDQTTSKNYYLHSINIKTATAFQKKDLIDPILNYLQQSEYFIKLQNLKRNKFNHL